MILICITKSRIYRRSIVVTPTMRNSFLPLPTSPQLFGFGSSEFRTPNLDSYSMLDSKINVHANCFFNLPKLFDNTQIGPGNYFEVHSSQPITLPQSSGYDQYGSSSNSSSIMSRDQQLLALNKKHAGSRSRTAVHGERKRPLEVEELKGDQKIIVKRKRPSPSAKQLHPQSKENPIELTESRLQVPVRRSQKIGDRITALQKLVSPYGKTDTASVLQEASLYIKLLQEQIQNLFQVMGSPYGSIRSLQPEMNGQENGEKQMDLRSRGLCLVPVSSVRGVTTEKQG